MKPACAVARRRARGQALVEFALVAPIFLLMLFSVIEFGRAVYTVHALNNAAREGARYAIVHGAESGCPSGPMPGGLPNYCDPTGSNVKERVHDYAWAVIDTGAEFPVTVCWFAGAPVEDANLCPVANAGGKYGDGTNERGQTVQVSVGYTFHLLIGADIPLPAFTLQGSSTLVVNH